MSSDFGTIMDALVTAAQGAVSGLTAERTIKYAEEIGNENFPYMCVYGPDEAAELGEFQLTTKKTVVETLLFTKGETQEALALKMDAVRDAIAADRTLGGIVQFAHIPTRTILEDPQVDTKAGYMVVEAVEQTGHIISAVINVDVQLTAGFSDWATLDTTVNTFVLGHLGGARLSSNLRADLDTIAAGVWRYQIAWVLTDYIPGVSSNAGAYVASFRVGVHYHIAPATDEATLIRATLMGKVDGLLDPENWKALAGVDHVPDDAGPTLSLDDLERVD